MAICKNRSALESLVARSTSSFTRAHPRLPVGVSHILGFGVRTVVGVAGRHVFLNAKSGLCKLAVSLASMYLTSKDNINRNIFQVSHISSFLLLAQARPPPTGYELF